VKARTLSIALLAALLLGPAVYQTQGQEPATGSNRASNNAQSSGEITLVDLLARSTSKRKARFFLLAPGTNENHSEVHLAPSAAAPAPTVTGNGILGRLTKWTGFSSSNSVIGDSTIYEDKLGKVGIGTDSPTSKLTVAGVIESTGGFKFPDGSVKTSPGVSHDGTLTGDGAAAPLGVAVPLVLTGAVSPGLIGMPIGIIKATNTINGGDSVIAVAGDSASGTCCGGIGVHAFGGMANGGGLNVGGTGVFGEGGSSVAGAGGHGVAGFGGRSTGDQGGTGGVFQGGEGDNDIGGEGVVASGGPTTFGSGFGGIGVRASGGVSNNGGSGVRAAGGISTGAGNPGGTGIEAFGGTGGGGGAVGLAGKFNGNVQVTGTLSKGGGAFRIDHPLDPENKYLSHSFVESPDMMNIYNGNITTDASGEAIVTLPDYFDALNKDFRYQLTVIGTFAQAIIGEEVRDNRFAIKTSAPNVRVSWQVTGIRHDAFANKNRILVEEEKTEVERGYYLHPNAFNQPEEKSINWAHDPEGMMQLRRPQVEAAKMRIQQPTR
jgi:hypothetical protein